MLSLGFAGLFEGSAVTAEIVSNPVSRSGVAAETLDRVSEAAGTGAFFTARALTMRAGLAELELDGLIWGAGLVTLGDVSAAFVSALKKPSFFLLMTKK